MIWLNRVLSKHIPFPESCDCDSLHVLRDRTSCWSSSSPGVSLNSRPVAQTAGTVRLLQGQFYLHSFSKAIGVELWLSAHFHNVCGKIIIAVFQICLSWAPALGHYQKKCRVRLYLFWSLLNRWQVQCFLSSLSMPLKAREVESLLRIYTAVPKWSSSTYCLYSKLYCMFEQFNTHNSLKFSNHSVSKNHTTLKTGYSWDEVEWGVWVCSHDIRDYPGHRSPTFQPTRCPANLCVPTKTRGRAVARRQSGSSGFPFCRTQPQLSTLVQIQSGVPCANRLLNIQLPDNLRHIHARWMKRQRRNSLFFNRCRLNIMDSNVPEDFTPTVLHKILTFKYP